MKANKQCPICHSIGKDKSKDALFLMSNGKGYCCRQNNILHKPYYEWFNNDYYNEDYISMYTIDDIKKLPIAELKDRGIKKDISNYYGVRCRYSEVNGSITHHYYPYYSKEGTIIGYKEREIDTKKFKVIGSIKDSPLFGANKISDSGKMLIITEGEVDALSAYQMLLSQGKDYRVVSLPSGANQAAIKSNLDMLSNYESIIVAYDMDEVGRKNAKDTLELLPVGVGKLCSMPLKDANDMLKAGRDKDFLKCIYNSKVIRPDGIVSGADTWDLIANRETVPSIPYPDGWLGLQEKTYGIRKGELDTWTSGSGSGKTSMLRELQYHIMNNSKDNIGVIALEEPLADSVEALMSIHLNKRIHLPDVRDTLTQDDMKDAWNAVMGDERFYFYDHFGSVNEDSLFSKINYLAKACNCGYIFLDHLSIVVSEYAADGDERKVIDKLMTKLKNATQHLGIWIGLVVHLRKAGSGKAFEEGSVPTVDDLRGSGSIKQLSNTVIATARNQQAEDEVERNTSSLHVLKCRYTGYTGQAGYLWFNPETGRMEAVSESINPDEEF